jgi:large subunit ribosomal protein L29
MKASDIREMSADDIRARITELEEERFRLKFRAATETLENPLQLRFIRRDIARLNTILREQALAAGAPRRGRKNVAAARRAAAGVGAAATGSNAANARGTTTGATPTKSRASKGSPRATSGAAKR